jgi:hypothetical protein
MVAGALATHDIRAARRIRNDGMWEDEFIHPPHAPRMHAHVGMIRWQRDGDGDWSNETVRGQYVGGDSSVWRVRLYSGIEMEYDLDVWAPFAPEA